MDIRAKTALVTAGARRLGRAIALALAKRGARVVISFLESKHEAHSTVREIEELGGSAIAIQADLSSVPQIEALFGTACERLGHVDILINNAAIFRKTPLDQITEHDWDAFLTTNLKATFFCSQIAARLMKKRGEGKIVNIACTSAERPWPSYIPYAASKAGVVSITRSMALALAPEIQVNAIAPGPVLLPDSYSPEERERAASTTLLRRKGSPSDVTRAVLFLIEHSDYITGQVVAVDGGRLCR